MSIRSILLFMLFGFTLSHFGIDVDEHTFEFLTLTFIAALIKLEGVYEGMRR